MKDSSRALGFLEGVYHTHRDQGFSSDDSDEASDEGCPIQRSLKALCYVGWTATSRSLGHAVGVFLSQKLNGPGVDWISEEAYAELESTAAGRSVPHSQWSAKEFLDNVIAGHFEESGDHISGQYCHICSDVSMIRRRLEEPIPVPVTHACTGTPSWSPSPAASQSLTRTPAGVAQPTASTVGESTPLTGAEIFTCP